VCGGKGAHSRRIPHELQEIGSRTGVDAAPLVRASRLVAKIDSAAVQDGFDLYLHAFFATVEGHWCIVQQGMNEDLGEARRYHWQSNQLPGFFESPHAAIEGRNVGRSPLDSTVPGSAGCLLLSFAIDSCSNYVAYLLGAREIPKRTCGARQVLALRLKIHRESRMSCRPHDVPFVAVACPLG